MNYRISESLKALKPYQPGQSDKDVKEKYNRDSFIKLASNESPLDPFPSVVQALSESLDNLNLYPDPSCRELLEAASDYYDLPSSQIMAGNGSNELIDLLIRLMCEPGDTVLTSEGAFIAYKVCTQANRAQLVEVKLNEDQSINLDNYHEKLKELEKGGKLPKVVFIPNPNNPTGTYIQAEDLKRFMSHWAGREDVILVVDEAYNEFVTASDFETAHPYIEKGNVIVLKTLSKVFGLAGLRLGFLLGASELIGFLHRIRNPFNVNSLAQVAGQAALKDKESIANIKKLITGERDRFEAELSKLSIDYTPSQANFVFFDTGMDVMKAHDFFLSEGLILRPLLPYGFQSQMRITIGDTKQMNEAVQVFKRFSDWKKDS